MRLGVIGALVLGGGLMGTTLAHANPGATVGDGAIGCRALQAHWDGHGAQAFSWGQGFMGGINLIRLIQSKNAIDLTPKDFPLAAQVSFVQAYCRHHPSDEVAHGFLELYRHMAVQHGVQFP